jgi:hypothetical protein
MKLELNHPLINLPIFQQVLKLKLVHTQNDYGTILSSDVGFIRYITREETLLNLTNRLDNILDFYKFSPNFTVPMYKFKNFTIADLYKITNVNDALSPEIMRFTV